MLLSPRMKLSRFSPAALVFEALVRQVVPMVQSWVSVSICGDRKLLCSLVLRFAQRKNLRLSTPLPELLPPDWNR
ncbi:MAG: hypothetical protein AW07_02116 [Candidatus Accumulibacter sp. SK-11]|nr:MAG: hypothetical protein AW07_02116 [Candidatus Accumulibacter sp. SK-11]